MANDNILFVIAQKDFNYREISVTKDILEKNNYQTKIASFRKKDAYSYPLYNHQRIIIGPDLTVEDSVNHLDDYAAVLIIGGVGCPTLNKEETRQLLQESNKLEKIIGGICLGPTILAKAGILDGRRATVWRTEEHEEGPEILKEHGAIYTGEDLTIDNNIITASTYEHAELFAYAINDKLKERQLAKVEGHEVKSERQAVKV
jgi:protease I